MTPNDEAPLWLQVVAVTVILAPTIVLLALRRRIGALNVACGLVIWGALAACGEHATWAMRLAIHEREWLNPHSDVHYFMAGAYAAIAGVLLSVIALTLLRERRRGGWFTVLFVLLVGGSLELAMNGPTGFLYHHIGLYGYVVAWLAALVITYRPTFALANQVKGTGNSPPPSTAAPRVAARESNSRRSQLSVSTDELRARGTNSTSFRHGVVAVPLA